MACNHSEAYIERKDADTRAVSRVAVPGHDCDYVDARNALIPAAEREATKRTMSELHKRGVKAGEEHQSSSFAGVFTLHFIAEMDRRCREAGLIK